LDIIHRPVFYLKTCFGNWILSPSSGGTYSDGPNKKSQSNSIQRRIYGVRSIKDNKEIKILQADKGNCMVVLNESTYKEKMASLLESGVCKILHKDPTSQIVIKKKETNSKP
jgi:hypothetical protein